MTREIKAGSLILRGLSKFPSVPSYSREAPGASPSPFPVSPLPLLPGPTSDERQQWAAPEDGDPSPSLGACVTWDSLLNRSRPQPPRLYSGRVVPGPPHPQHQ